jgi:predicted acetyltransferase
MNTRSPVLLRRLLPGDEAAFLQGVLDWEGEDLSWHSFEYKPGMPFADLLQILADVEAGRNLLPDRVPATMLYGFVADKIVGRVSIRHHLNDHLLKLGGHIGWAVAPAFRRHGYATAMVFQALPVMRELGINRALITCSDSNVASQRIIAKLDGKLENTVFDEGLQRYTQRYWASLE